jgi:heterodisulfide reductase subunit A
VVFIRFDEAHYPQLEAAETALNLKATDISDGKEKTVAADYLILSTGMDPNRENNAAFAALFDLKLDDDGFFDVESCACPYEDASKRIMKPFELSSNGVFVVGTAHSPRSLMESVMMARQAAGKATVILPAGKMAPPNAMYVSGVDESKCTGCGLCVDVCPYHAREIDPVRKVAVVRPFLCDSCGACVVACPSSAAFLRDQREDQLIRSVDGLLAV